MKRNAHQQELATRAGKILDILSKSFPNAACRLDHRNGLELLVATILAAQCTDVKVNEVTKALFKRYRKATDYAEADPATLQAEIRPTGFFRNKAKSIIAAARALTEKHNGRLPKSVEEMVALPGVGRKTANVLLGNLFGRPAIIVDTHFKRVMDRVGLTSNADPDKIEADIRDLLPPKRWTRFSYVVNDHGRLVCQARKPKCDECKITGLCDFYRENPP